MTKKKRKYTKKGKGKVKSTPKKTSGPLVMNMSTADTATIDNVDSVDFWESQEEKAEREERSDEPIDTMPQSAKDLEKYIYKKVSEKKDCSACAEIDYFIKTNYIVGGISILGLLLVANSHRKNQMSPMLLGFYYGGFTIMLFRAVTDIFKARKLKSELIKL